MHQIYKASLLSENYWKAGKKEQLVARQVRADTNVCCLVQPPSSPGSLLQKQQNGQLLSYIPKVPAEDSSIVLKEIFIALHPSYSIAITGKHSQIRSTHHLCFIRYLILSIFTNLLDIYLTFTGTAESYTALVATINFCDIYSRYVGYMIATQFSILTIVIYGIYILCYLYINIR